MKASKVYTLFSSAARYASENSSSIDLSTFDKCVFVLRVTAMTGAPTSLDIAIQGSGDNSNFGPFQTALAFTQITAGTEVVEILPQPGPLGAYVRAAVTIVGGAAAVPGPEASFTFALYAVCQRLR